MNRDLLEYQKSLALELTASMDRVRHLIGKAHWGTDGEHKESVLRQILRERLPESAAVGRGFVCFPTDEVDQVQPEDGEYRNSVTSRQIDILITKRSEPCLYRVGDLVFVTPEAVKALVEVKTGLTSGSLEETLTKLATDVATIRRIAEKGSWAALFVYEQRDLDPDTVLEKLAATARGGVGAVNCVALGKNWFFRFWPDGHEVGGIDGPVWHAYRLVGLAPGYFVGNIAVNLGGELSAASERLWFPIPGTKEAARVAYISLLGGGVKYFPQNP